MCFLLQAEDGIRDIGVTGVQTCALPIYEPGDEAKPDDAAAADDTADDDDTTDGEPKDEADDAKSKDEPEVTKDAKAGAEIGRACVGKECRSRWSPYH